MKTQSRTTKVLQSLSLSSKSWEEKNSKRNLGPRPDHVLFRTKEKQIKEKDSKRWSRAGLLLPRGQNGALGSQTTQQGLSLPAGELLWRQTRVEGSCHRSSPASGPGRGSLGVLEFDDSQTFSISLAVFQTLGVFFLSPENVIKLRGQRPLTGEGFQRPPQAAATLAQEEEVSNANT